MNIKKLGFVLCASAAFGLVACGDSSSTSSDNENDAKAEYMQLQEDILKGLEKLGECTSENEGSEKSITVLGKDYKVVCEDGEWENEDLDKLVDEYEKKLENLIQGNGCGFKLDDKIWNYDVSADVYGAPTNKTSMQIDGTTLIEKSITTVSGSNISVACKYMTDEDKYSKEDYGDGITVETIVECDGDQMTTTDVTTTKNAVDKEHDRAYYFEQFMDQCKVINGIEDEENDDDDEGDDEGGKENGSSSDAPISEGPSDDTPVSGGNTDVGVGAVEATYTCDLDYDKDVWKVSSTDITNTTMTVVYEWNGNDLHQYHIMGIKLDSQDECEAMMSRMPESSETSCKDGVLSSKSDLGTFTYSSDEERKELYNLIKANECSK